MPSSDIETASFGPFRLWPATRKLERNGVSVALGDRALDILIVLIEHGGEIVGHRDLISRVWRGLVVSPANLRVHMTVLRKALGDGEDGVRYIENVTGQGYCFIAQINVGSSAASPAPFLADLVTERFISALGPEDAGNTTQRRQEGREPYLSNDVEYALHCLLFLGGRSGSPLAMSSRDLAELQGLPAEHVQKIFAKLHEAEIVCVVEGSGGGFALARAPEKISFLDVITAIDGRHPLFECTNIRLRCALFGGKAPVWATKGVCAIHAVMLEAEASMRAVLASRMLADLASRLAAKAPATFVDDLANWLARRAADGRRID